METAIIYRANKTLSSRMADLKDKVDLFKEFPKEATEEEIAAWAEVEMVGEVSEVIDGETIHNPRFDRVICDLTSYTAMLKAGRVSFPEGTIIIKQSEGLLNEYAGMIAREAYELGKEVAIVRDRLAHHINIDGVDPYEIGDGRDTWYLEQALAIWQKALAGIPFDVVNNDVDVGALQGKVVVCDHHNGELNSKLHKLGRGGLLIYRSAYPPASSRPYADPSEVV